MTRYKAYAEYKDSGVEWLGLVPQHWSARQLKFLCTCNDEVLGDATHSEYEIEYIDIGSVSASEGISKTETMLFSAAPSRARRIVRDGDVIISTVRTYLEAIASIDKPPPNLVVSTGFTVIRPNQHLHKKFAAYCLRASGFIKEVIARSVGVSYPAINAADLIDIKTPLPQFNEQEKIANFLDHETAKIDTLIAKQQELIKLLKEKRQAVISHSVTKGLNPNAPMRDSGVAWFRSLPVHWRVVKLKYIVSQIVDGAHFTPTYVDEGVPFLRVTDIQSDKIDKSNIKYIPLLEHEELIKRCKPEKGDLLLSKNGTIGIPKIVDWDWDFSIFVSLCLIKFNEKIDINYAYFFFLTHEISEQISALVKQSTVINLHLDKIENFIFTLPPLSEQREIVKYLGEILSAYDVQVANGEKMTKLLYERRTALISAAVTGKIDVRDWQAPPQPAPEPEAAVE